jgi:hypothetical protein
VLENTFVYGSFTNMTPNIDNHHLSIRGPKTFKISEPKAYTTFEEKFYYLTLESPDDVKLCISARQHAGIQINHNHDDSNVSILKPNDTVEDDKAIGEVAAIRK